MRLVTIDNGNTNPSVAFFDDDVLKSIIPLSQYTPENRDYILISSVGKSLKIKPSFDLKTKRTKSHFFDMPVHYSETLGDDRLIAGYAIYKMLKGKQKVLLVDAGTFITCDLITDTGFAGGYIFPGLEHFLNSYTDSALLPHLSTSDFLKHKSSLPLHLPQNTHEAILGATQIYLQSTLTEVAKQMSPDKIIFTGGSGQWIKDLLNLETLSELNHHLLHLALSMIYQIHLTQVTP